VLVLLPAGVLLSYMDLKLLMRTSMTTKIMSHALSSWPGKLLGLSAGDSSDPAAEGRPAQLAILAAICLQEELLLLMLQLEQQALGWV
jgi:hypothetical protein